MYGGSSQLRACGWFVCNLSSSIEGIGWLIFFHVLLRGGREGMAKIKAVIYAKLQVHYSNMLK